MPRSFAHAPDTADTEAQLPAYSPLLARLLAIRGHSDPVAAERFLKPDYEAHMNDPFLMHDMGKAVERIYRAVTAKDPAEKTVVYADYDCDGIPGAVMLHDFFKKIGYENFSVYIPDRHREGYGLNRPALEQFIADGVTLVITIDLGTTNHDDIAHAQEAGIDVIVTDHHLPHATLPNAHALVNPKVGTYPDPMLCGSGVIFKLIQAFLSKHGKEFGVLEGWEKWLLDMAGLATLSDMVPLVGENRVIARYGMHVLRKSPRPGLGQLLSKLAIDQRTISEDDLTFMVTPRLNAASRMDSPMRAFELLAERDPREAGARADHLTRINDERKKLVAHIMKEAKHTLAERTIGPVIVIGNPEWRVGVLGLVAGKIMDEYDRPVFVWGREGMEESASVKGSCRSPGSVNLVNLMEAGREHFLEFGGHELAGGFSISQDSVHFLEEKLCALFEVHKQEGGAGASLIDAVLSLGDVNAKTCAMLETMSPFGLGNPKPVFQFPTVTIKKARQFGKEKNHLELIVADLAGIERTAMAFFADGSTFSREATEGSTVDLLATVEKSYFRGRESIRLRIADIQ